MRKFILAALLLVGIGGTGAKADPILTPIFAAAFANTALAGGVTILGSTVAYAAIASYVVTAGPALPVSFVGGRP